VFGALDQIADVVDVFGLQAVGRTHGQFQVVDRTQQYGVDLRRGASRGAVVGVAGAFQGRKHRDLVHQDAGRLANRFFRRDHAIGFDVQDELVQVGALFHTGAFDSVADAAHGAVGRVQQDAADGVGTI